MFMEIRRRKPLVFWLGIVIGATLIVAVIISLRPIAGTMGPDGTQWRIVPITRTLIIQPGDITEGTMLWRDGVPPWLIRRIKIEGPLIATTTNLGSLFSSLPNLVEITGLDYMDTSEVTSMSYMFSGVSSLETLDLSGFDTSAVTDMCGMFAGMDSLKTLDISGFETSSVTIMNQMFWEASALVILDLSGFDTSAVTTMSYMFSDANSLESLDVSSFNTSSVTNMHGMFDNVRSLKSLDLSGFDTSAVTNMHGMFYNSRSLESLNLSSFDTSSVTSMELMFFHMSSLRSLDISSFDTEAVNSMRWMFSETDSLENITFGANFVSISDASFSGAFPPEKLIGAIPVKGFAFRSGPVNEYDDILPPRQWQNQARAVTLDSYELWEHLRTTRDAPETWVWYA